jgi:hypothetical protein
LGRGKDFNAPICPNNIPCFVSQSFNTFLLSREITIQQFVKDCAMLWAFPFFLLVYCCKYSLSKALLIIHQLFGPSFEM